jgi:hypothetical protein
MRFTDFRSHATNIRIFKNPSFDVVCDTLDKFQIELIEMQHDSILGTNSNPEALINYFLYFFTSISVL